MNFTNVLARRTNKTIYRDGDTVVKVFGEGFKKADVLNEALNHARVEETELHVPKLYGVGMTDDDKWYIQTEYIEGKTLAEQAIAAQANTQPVAAPRCPQCNQPMQSKGGKAKTVVAQVGDLQFARTHYYCPHCERGVFPPG